MPDVSCDDVGLRADRHGLVVGHAATHPCSRIKMPKKMNRRAADVFKFVDKISQRNVRMIPVLHPWILIEAGKGGGVIPCKDESAVSEDALCIDDMSEK